MKEGSNTELFSRRAEPPFLKDPHTGQYVNLRTTNNITLLQTTLDHLVKGYGTDYVIASWISPPLGIIRGYGVYARDEAEQLAMRSKQQRWGFPRFGALYDKERLEERIRRLQSKYQQRAVAYHS